MYAPAQDSEINGIIGYADQQLGAIRASVYGLTDEQAASTPCRSALSVIGIVKHIERGMRGAIDRLRGDAAERVVDEASIAEYMGSFSLADGESAHDVLDRFDATRQEFLAALRDADPDADAVEPPAPWAGITEPRPIKTRFYLVHQIEEYARHAGHADIIREQIDGQSIAALEMSIAGAPANPFFTPFVPEPGTLA